jgi:hypothetical protein
MAPILSDECSFFTQLVQNEVTFDDYINALQQQDSRWGDDVLCEYRRHCAAGILFAHIEKADVAFAMAFQSHKHTPRGCCHPLRSFVIFGKTHHTKSFLDDIACHIDDKRPEATKVWYGGVRAVSTDISDAASKFVADPQVDIAKETVAFNLAVTFKAFAEKALRMYDVLPGLTKVKMTRPWRDDASFHKGRKVMAKEIQRSVKLLTIKLERASSFGIIVVPTLKDMCSDALSTNERRSLKRKYGM